MAKRKKRLGKGIVSIAGQIQTHEGKLMKAQEEGKEELAGYYKKEIGKLRKSKERKVRQLGKA